MTIEHLNKNDIISAIDRIEAFNLRTVSIKELEDELKSLLKGFKIIVPKLNSEIYLYRGRICDKPKNLSDIIYPPSNSIRCYGRANDIGEQLFYAANSRNVAFYELSAKVGDHIAIGTWKSTTRMILNHVGFTAECKDVLNSDRKLESIYKFVTNMNNFGELNNYLHSYLASKFTTIVNTGEEWKYKISIAISNIFLTGDIINGLMYPTLAMLGNADNVVLKPAYFLKYMEFVSVEYAEITKKEGMRYFYDINDSATKLDGENNLIWSGRNLQWTLKKKGAVHKFKREAGNNVIFDQYGKRIDPE